MNRRDIASALLIVALVLGGAATIYAMNGTEADGGSGDKNTAECWTKYGILRSAVIDAINIRERTGVTPEARAIVLRALVRTGEKCHWITDQAEENPIPVFVCD